MESKLSEHFKDKKHIDRLIYLHPIAILILFDMMNFTTDCKHPFIVTDAVSTVDEDMQLRRISISHRTGRAFDISIHEWPEDFLYNFKLHFTQKYGQYGAISYKTGKSKLIVDHSGTARHLHVQIHSKYSLEINLPHIH